MGKRHGSVLLMLGPVLLGLCLTPPLPAQTARSTGRTNSGRLEASSGNAYQNWVSAPALMARYNRAGPVQQGWTGTTGLDRYNRAGPVQQGWTGTTGLDRAEVRQAFKVSATGYVKLHIQRYPGGNISPSCPCSMSRH